ARRGRPPAGGVLWRLIRHRLRGDAATAVPDPIATGGGPLGRNRSGGVRNGAHQRIPAWRAHRLASRRTAVRHRGGRLAAFIVPDEVSSLRSGCATGHWTASGG